MMNLDELTDRIHRTLDRDGRVDINQRWALAGDIARDILSEPQAQDEAAEQAAYEALRSATNPIEAFNLFVERNVDPALHMHYADSDDNEAEFVRRVIRAAMGVRVLVSGGGGVGQPGVRGAGGGGYPGGGVSVSMNITHRGGPGGGGSEGRPPPQ